jgi:LysM repeat protein
VSKAAQRASIAAPAVAVSGALAAAPAFMSASPVHEALAQASPHPVTAHLDAVVQTAAPAAPAARTYKVRSGDTLSGIALRYYGHASEWHGLYRVNRSKISNPDLIYAGQVLAVPKHLKHAAAADPSSASTSADVTQSSGSQASTTQSSGGSSSATVTSDVQSDIANGNNLLAIGQFLVANGYSKAAAAGVASCVDGESAGNPESVGSGGGGLIGWTPISSASPNGNIITGNVAQDMMTQLSDLLFYNSNEIGQAQVSELNAISDPVAAADFYSQTFERPAVTDSDVRPSVAEQIFSELGG